MPGPFCVPLNPQKQVDFSNGKCTTHLGNPWKIVTILTANPRHEDLWIRQMIITIWLFNIAMENGPFIDGLPIKNGDFPWLC